MFCWALAHKIILTDENLMKRGMEGPTRCPLCKAENESSDHILLGYPFSKEVWNQALKMNPGINLPVNTQDFLLEWMNLSPFRLAKKPLLQTAWNWILKATC